MASLKDRLSARVQRLRARRPVVDHAVRMQEHYGACGASQQAGAITYFGFLSFFPLMGLAFFVVGWIAMVYPEATQDLKEALDQVLPGLIGNEDGQIPLRSIEDAAGVIGPLSLVFVLYSGLGWVTAVRDALQVVFELPDRAVPGFVTGKLRDLVSLVAIGLILFLSVALAGFVTAFSDLLLDWVGLGEELDAVVQLVGRAIGFGANVLLFYALFRLLSHARTPRGSLWSGAVLGAVAFEALKALSFLLLASTEGSPAFQAFGIALILVVWINYFSRVILYAAAWAHTTAKARAIRDQEALERAQMEELTKVVLHEAPTMEPEAAGRSRTTGAFAAGGATALALVALMRKKDQA